jgi:hypothetical protein
MPIEWKSLIFRLRGEMPASLERYTYSLVLIKLLWVT